MKRETLWLPVPGDARYSVSSDGRIRRETAGKGTWAGRITKGSRRSDGYMQIFGLPFNMVHQAVAAAFHGPCPDGCEVNHKDGRRENNKSSNLEYVTRSENILHGYNILNPHRRVQRAEQSRINGKSAKGKTWKRKTPIGEAERQSRARRAAGKPAWWLSKGFSSLREATKGKA